MASSEDRSYPRTSLAHPGASSSPDTSEKPIVLDANSTADAVNFAFIYDELRAMARRFFETQPSAHTLQPTALVHEVFLRLAASGNLSERGQCRLSSAHLANLCARAMRQVLVDHARSRVARRRREGVAHEAILQTADSGAGSSEGGSANAPAPSVEEVIDLHEALQRYESLDERRSRLVELRIFGGFSLERSADLLGVSRSTVSEDWRVARAWLTQAMAAS
jgi:RNA polymerase sigma factor (TIGR02999 family)